MPKYHTGDATADAKIDACRARVAAATDDDWLEVAAAAISEAHGHIAGVAQAKLAAGRQALGLSATVPLPGTLEHEAEQATLAAKAAASGPPRVIPGETLDEAIVRLGGKL